MAEYPIFLKIRNKIKPFMNDESLEWFSKLERCYMVLGFVIIPFSCVYVIFHAGKAVYVGQACKEDIERELKDCERRVIGTELTNKSSRNHNKTNDTPAWQQYRSDYSIDTVSLDHQQQSDFLQSFSVFAVKVESHIDRIFLRGVLTKILEPQCNDEVFNDHHQFKRLFEENPKLSDENVQLEIVKKNGLAIQFFDNPSIKLQFVAVNQNPDALEEIIKKKINPPNLIINHALSKNPSTIRLISNPTDEQQIFAVSISGSAIQYIQNPNEAVKKAAIKQSGYAISCIESPNHSLQLLAVRSNGFALQSIIEAGIVPDRDVIISAIRKSPGAIQFIDNPDVEIQILAVKRDPLAFYHIAKNGFEPCEEAASISKDPVINDLLKTIKQFGIKQIYHNIQSLRQSGIDWPEIRTIEKSLVSELQMKTDNRL